MSSLKNNISTLILGDKGCMCTYRGVGGSKMARSERTNFMDDPLQCNHHLSKKLIFYGIEILETYFSRNQLSAE